MNEKSPQKPPLIYFFLAGLIFAVTNAACAQLFKHWGEFKMWVARLFS